MFDHGALYGFIGGPFGGGGEAVDLKRDAFACRVHHADEYLLVADNCGVVEQPLAQIGPEKSEVCRVGAVDNGYARIVVGMAEVTEVADVGFDDRVSAEMASTISGVVAVMVSESMITERAMRRQPLSAIPRQFRKEVDMSV